VVRPDSKRDASCDAFAPGDCMRAMGAKTTRHIIQLINRLIRKVRDIR
jgi:hypothetical protein